MTRFIQSCVDDPHTTISNEETFLQNFQLLENFEEIFPLYYMYSDAFHLFNLKDL